MALLERLFEVTAGDGQRGYTLEVRVSNTGAIRLYEHAGAVVPPDDDERHLPRARFHAELATGFGPVELVEPLYVRLPDAVEVAR